MDFQLADAFPLPVQRTATKTISCVRTALSSGLVWLAIAIAASTPVRGRAGGDDGSAAPRRDSGDLVRELQNPVAKLISVPFQNNTNFGFGPNEEALNVLNVQPVWPFELGADWNLITRTIVPITSQPGLLPGQGRKSGLGDITFTAFLAPSDSGKLIWGLGPVFLLPTASDERLGSDKWGLGPSFVVLTMRGKWVLGALVSNVWSVGGPGRSDVDLFSLQYFLNYNLPKGWYLTSAPIMTANWEAASDDDRWTVPLGGGFGKLISIGPLPVNLMAQGFYNVVKPSATGDWSLRLQLQLVFPK